MSPEEQDYIPGTQVIRNLVDRGPGAPWGTSDPQRLSSAENALVAGRIADLQESPVEGSFDFRHMREVHQALFQDVYAWAGQPRRVPMTKLGTPYVEPQEMNAVLRTEYARLAAADFLRGITSSEEFAERLADHWGTINHAHAFREGNTRSQTVFFQQLAEAAGHRLDVARLAPAHPRSLYQDFVDARFAQQRLVRRGVGSAEASLDLAEVLGRLVERPGIDKRPISSLDPDLLARAAGLDAQREDGPQPGP